MLLTHWILEFMKQVLPRLLSPVAPFSVGTDENIATAQHHYLESEGTAGK